MKICMSDLVAKAQGKKGRLPLTPDKYHRYRYHGGLKTICQLAKISGIASSTLHSRFQRGTYASVEEAVDTPTPFLPGKG